uniref:Uncharacterized protein n=1 Tax=Anopheles atroparvus TaxID=41427 RepID=A0A182JN22_ANOAO
MNEPNAAASRWENILNKPAGNWKEMVRRDRSDDMLPEIAHHHGAQSDETTLEITNPPTVARKQKLSQTDRAGGGVFWSHFVPCAHANILSIVLFMASSSSFLDIFYQWKDKS